MNIGMEILIGSICICFVLGFLVRMGFRTMATYFSEMNRRFDKIEARFDKIETHFDRRCDLLEKDMVMIANSVRDLDLRVTIVETRLEERNNKFAERRGVRNAVSSMPRLRRIRPKEIGQK